MTRALFVSPPVWLAIGAEFCEPRWGRRVRTHFSPRMAAMTEGAAPCFEPWSPPFRWRFSADFAQRQKARRQLGLVSQLQEMGVATEELSRAAAELKEGLER